MEAAAPGKATDHIHQKSLWFCHGDVIAEGITLKHKIKGVEGTDFWSEAPGHGQILCVKVGKPEVSGSIGQVETVNESRTADEKNILDETRKLKLINYGPPSYSFSTSICSPAFARSPSGTRKRDLWEFASARS